MKGDHLPGLDCLSDEQAVPILMHMDVDTLLHAGRYLSTSCLFSFMYLYLYLSCHVKICLSSFISSCIFICARASSRLFRLVCDPQIWRQVFKHPEENFTKETVGKLVTFCTRDNVCREIKAEVVKLAAQGIADGSDMDLKITLAIQSWGDPELFVVNGFRFEEVANVEERVGVRATILAVEQADREWWCGGVPVVETVYQQIVEMILARNDRCLGGLDRLELVGVNLCLSENPHNLFFLSLLKASKRWKVGVLFMDSFKDIWMMLAHISKVGRIDCLVIRPTEPVSLDAVDRENLRKVWEISKQVGFPRPCATCNVGTGYVLFEGGLSTQPLEHGGGGTLEEDWQSVLQFVERGGFQQQGGAV